MRFPSLCVASAAAILVSGVFPGSMATMSPARASVASTVAEPPVVRTTAGAVQGISVDGVDNFRGIPYARPPVGDLRWRPPAAVTAWPGTRDATRFGGSCPALAGSNGPLSLTEDCLFVNVFRPTGTAATDARAVLAFVYGGGLRDGSSNQYEGALIAQRTGVVVVTLNYRLGAFGFLGDAALTRESGESGNYGLQDQQAALRWVRDNIRAFGGDPAKVTLGGESAGAFSTCAHLGAPGSRGLFRAAIMQSGACGSRTLAEAEGAGRAVATTLGCALVETDLRCMRAASTQAILNAAQRMQVGFSRGTPTLPVDPRAALTSGRAATVPVLFGANLDEARTFTHIATGWTRLQYETLIRSLSEDLGARVLAAYPWPANATSFTAPYLLGAVFTDDGPIIEVGGCATRRLAADIARRGTTFAYEFAHRNGPGLMSQPAGYVAGAGHAAELPYLWPSFHNGTPVAPTFAAAERQLSDHMLASWGAFVRTGAPGDAQAWPAYAGGRQVRQLLPGTTSRVANDRAYTTTHQCGLWDSVTWPTPAGEALLRTLLGF
jgi:carboxylesterase type B